MLAPTHVTFGLVFAIVAGTGLGLVLTPSTGAFACLGALLPDVDTPTSTIGRLAAPLARALERRFGHRTVTHSFVGLALATAPVAPLAWLNPQWPLAFGLGYLSHLLIDCANKAGVPLFYPSPIRAVLPRSEAFRVAVGSRAELGVLVALAVALAILLPLHEMGFTRALHALTRTMAGAIRDYRGWQGRNEVWVQVDGIFQRSARRVQARYRVLGVVDAATLVVLDPGTGQVHSVGTSRDADLYPDRIRAHQGRAIRVRSRPVVLTQQLLGDLLREVPREGETYFLGTVKTADAPVVTPQPEQYEVLRAGARELELRFARPRDLQDPALATLFVLSGQVLVQTTVPDGAAPSPAPTSAVTAPPEFDDVTELVIPHLTDPARELRVREGERIRQGQLLARLTYQDPELDRDRQRAEATLAEKAALLSLQEAKVRQTRALVAARLAAPGALEREEAGLLRARDAVAQARRELARVAEEARRLTEIRAPLDGHVLTIRLSAVRGNEATATIRFLYRKTSSSDRA
jgi:inner membrane protein